MKFQTSVPLIAAILIFLPLPWHWRYGNVATLSLIAWFFVANLISFVNAYLWQDDVDIRAVIWCDISTHIFLGAQVALPAASLCICIRLFKASAGKGLTQHTAQSIRRRAIMELSICFVLPLVYMGLSYVAQGHRFNIVKTLGCTVATYNTIVAIFIVDLPPLLCSLIATVYAGLAIFYLQRHYRSFIENLKRTDTNRFALLHYYRLLAMAVVVTVWMNAVTAYVLIGNIQLGTNPYISWDNVHADFSRIGQYDLATSDLNKDLVTWYSLPLSAFIFVVLFSCGEDAMVEYRRVWTSIYAFLGVGRLLKWLGVARSNEHQGSSTNPDATKNLESLRFDHPPQTTLSGGSRLASSLRSKHTGGEVIEVFPEASRSEIEGVV